MFCSISPWKTWRQLVNMLPECWLCLFLKGVDAKVPLCCCPRDAECVYLDRIGFLLIIIEMRMLMFVCPQVYIRILDNEWNVYRRYTEFRELHNQLRAQFPQVDTFNFPPKKALGNKVSLQMSVLWCSTRVLQTLYALIWTRSGQTWSWLKALVTCPCMAAAGFWLVPTPGRL